jgi:hypothetical protein
MRLPDTQRLSDAASTAATNKPSVASGNQAPGAAGAAPPSATLPPPTLAASDEQLEAPPNSPHSADQIKSAHEEASQLDEPPAQQGFFKGLMSKLTSLVKGNSNVVLTAGVILGLTVGIGGAAALLPALVGLALGGATLAGLGSVKPLPPPETEEEDDPAQKASSDVTPQRHEEQERMKELERKLADAQAKLSAQKAVQEEVDLLGLNEIDPNTDLLVLNDPPQNGDLLSVLDQPPSLQAGSTHAYAEQLRGVFEEAPSLEEAPPNDLDALARAAEEVIRDLKLDDNVEPLIDLEGTRPTFIAERAAASPEFQELFGNKADGSGP